VSAVRPEFVESFPEVMEQAVLYVSIPYRTCGHLCCCGCGQEVITPLSPAQWSVTFNGQDVSLWPSVGNWALPCQSHYWIREGKVVWSRRYSSLEIAANRDDDRRRLAEHLDASMPVPQTEPPRRRVGRRRGSRD
jgi:hypothetical protein